MSIGIVKLKKEDETCSLWIDEGEGFSDQEFLRVIAPLKIARNERVHTSHGPAQTIDEIHTSQGVFNLSQEFDEYPGVSIYSDDSQLINNILNLMVSSGEYHISG